MSKLNLAPVWNFVKVAGKVIGAGALLALACGVRVEYEHHESEGVTYSDAVNAIMNSTMWHDDKSEAIAVLSRDANEELYKAIIHVANGKMWSDDKLKTIKNLCGK